jgi:hypothetical protein
MPEQKDHIKNIFPWSKKVSHYAQIGGIETSVLDNGIARGTRIAWINTGTGLRYKIVIDRAMDIADAFFNQHSLAWISHTGITAPQPFSNHGTDWLKTFGGGLLTTCGLDHTGGPETDAFGERGLHGPVSNIPATIASVVQPDPAAGNLNFSITGHIQQVQPLGTCLELKRTISGKLGEAAIRVRDEVTNKGNTSAPHMLLYHCNFGWPLADEGADIVWKGNWQSREGKSSKIFVKGKSFQKCSPPLTSHNGTGEEAAFIDIEKDEEGKCACGIYNQQLGIAVSLSFNKAELPWLINWQHWGHGEYVTGLEPATQPPIGQAAARADNTLIFLEPGESRKYSVDIEVLYQQEKIDQFLKHSAFADQNNLNY